MTFTTLLKEELSKTVDNDIEKRLSLIAFLNINAKIDEEIILSSETVSVIRKINVDLRSTFNVNPIIRIRIQKRFKEKPVYILEINENVELITNSILYSDIEKLCSTKEERVAYLKGAFLAGGSITDPKNSGYHLEFSSKKEKYAADINNILNKLGLSSKIIIRGSKFIVYIKAAEEISDLIKMFKAVNSLFYYEDIRIYRDHKNTINRITNCEIANQEKSLKAGLTQLDDILFLKDNNLLDLLDEKSKIVAQFREEYPDASYTELSELITNETNYKVGKSGVNHKFIKIKSLVKKYKEGGKNE